MIEQILEQLDALSTKMIVGGTGVPELLQALDAIGRSARNGGNASLASAAAELASRASGSIPEEFEAVVTAGLDVLRHVLEPGSVGASAAASIAEDPELIGDFITEAGEHLAAIEANVLELERDPTAADPLHAAFRSFHTIKGLAGFLELTDIRAVAHEVETLLDRARNHEITLTPDLIDVILESADYLKRAVAWVGDGLNGTAGDPPETATVLAHFEATLIESSREDVPAGSTPAPSSAVGTVPETDTAAPLITDAVNTPEIPEPSAETPTSAKSEAVSPNTGNSVSGASTLRVDAAKLDFLMEMVGELVIAQSMIAHNPEMNTNEGSPLQRNLQQLGRITGDVQRLAMSLRMTPVGQLFTRMTRLVRDLSRKNGKQVQLELSGEETELDKTIIEQLADPLMHMVRNSLDHGLEPPEERIANGKPAEGKIWLSASHQAGQIVIEVRDDGRGLNAEKILRKAREKGLIPEGHNPNETEIFFLIFEPGFSTADQVTDVSGRGVGMDVVRRQIQTLRGRIDIQSKRNGGTTFFLRLPLTLAIIDGLIASVGAERYVLPISSVREMLRPTEDMLFSIEGRAEMAMVRGELLPVVRLNQRFGIAGGVQNPCEGLFVVAESGGRRFCLLVDRMLAKQEVVIKTLGETFSDVAGISGGAILGDGRVGLILDLNGVFNPSSREPADV